MAKTVTLSWKTVGFSAAIFLGLLLAIMPDNLAVGNLDPRLAEYAASMPPEGYVVDAPTLADWLVSEQPPLVVDVRERWQYDEYHIEGALHLPMQRLVSSEGLDQIDPEQVVVVVGRGEAGPAQAVAVWRLAGREAWVLKGGLDAWWHDVLRPASLDGSIPGDELPAEAARRAQWRARFLGATGETSFEVPAGHAAPPPTTSGSKKKSSRGKGC